MIRVISKIVLIVFWCSIIYQPAGLGAVVRMGQRFYTGRVPSRATTMSSNLSVQPKPKIPRSFYNQSRPRMGTNRRSKSRNRTSYTGRVNRNLRRNKVNRSPIRAYRYRNNFISSRYNRYRYGSNVYNGRKYSRGYIYKSRPTRARFRGSKRTTSKGGLPIRPQRQISPISQPMSPEESLLSKIYNKDPGEENVRVSIAIDVAVGVVVGAVIGGFFGGGQGAKWGALIGGVAGGVTGGVLYSQGYRADLPARFIGEGAAGIGDQFIGIGNFFIGREYDRYTDSPWARLNQENAYAFIDAGVRTRTGERDYNRRKKIIADYENNPAVIDAAGDYTGIISPAAQITVLTLGTMGLSTVVTGGQIEGMSVGKWAWEKSWKPALNPFSRTGWKTYAKIGGTVGATFGLRAAWGAGVEGLKGDDLKKYTLYQKDFKTINGQRVLTDVSSYRGAFNFFSDALMVYSFASMAYGAVKPKNISPGLGGGKWSGFKAEYKKSFVNFSKNLASGKFIMGAAKVGHLCAGLNLVLQPVVATLYTGFWQMGMPDFLGYMKPYTDAGYRRGDFNLAKVFVSSLPGMESKEDGSYEFSFKRLGDNYKRDWQMGVQFGLVMNAIGPVFQPALTGTLGRVPGIGKFFSRESFFAESEGMGAGARFKNFWKRTVSEEFIKEGVIEFALAGGGNVTGGSLDAQTGENIQELFGDIGGSGTPLDLTRSLREANLTSSAEISTIQDIGAIEQADLIILEQFGENGVSDIESRIKAIKEILNSGSVNYSEKKFLEKARVVLERVRTKNSEFSKFKVQQTELKQMKEKHSKLSQKSKEGRIRGKIQEIRSKKYGDKYRSATQQYLEAQQDLMIQLLLESKITELGEEIKKNPGSERLKETKKLFELELELMKVEPESRIMKGLKPIIAGMVFGGGSSMLGGLAANFASNVGIRNYQINDLMERIEKQRAKVRELEMEEFGTGEIEKILNEFTEQFEKLAKANSDKKKIESLKSIDINKLFKLKNDLSKFNKNISPGLKVSDILAKKIDASIGMYRRLARNTVGTVKNKVALEEVLKEGSSNEILKSIIGEYINSLKKDEEVRKVVLSKFENSLNRPVPVGGAIKIKTSRGVMVLSSSMVNDVLKEEGKSEFSEDIVNKIDEIAGELSVEQQIVFRSDLLNFRRKTEMILRQQGLSKVKSMEELGEKAGRFQGNEMSNILLDSIYREVLNEVVVERAAELVKMDIENGNFGVLDELENPSSDSPMELLKEKMAKEGSHIRAVQEIMDIVEGIKKARDSGVPGAVEVFLKRVSEGKIKSEMGKFERFRKKRKLKKLREKLKSKKAESETLRKNKEKLLEERRKLQEQPEESDTSKIDQINEEVERIENQVGLIEEEIKKLEREIEEISGIKALRKTVEKIVKPIETRNRAEELEYIAKVSLDAAQAGPSAARAAVSAREKANAAKLLVEKANQASSVYESMLEFQQALVYAMEFIDVETVFEAITGKKAEEMEISDRAKKLIDEIEKKEKELSEEIDVQKLKEEKKELEKKLEELMSDETYKQMELLANLFIAKKLTKVKDESKRSKIMNLMERNKTTFIKMTIKGIKLKKIGFEIKVEEDKKKSGRWRLEIKKGASNKAEKYKNEINEILDAFEKVFGKLKIKQGVNKVKVLKNMLFSINGAFEIATGAGKTDFITPLLAYTVISLKKAGFEEFKDFSHVTALFTDAQKLVEGSGVLGKLSKLLVDLYGEEQSEGKILIVTEAKKKTSKGAEEIKFKNLQEEIEKGIVKVASIDELTEDMINNADVIYTDQSTLGFLRTRAKAEDNFSVFNSLIRDSYFVVDEFHTAALEKTPYIMGSGDAKISGKIKVATIEVDNAIREVMLEDNGWLEKNFSEERRQQIRSKGDFTAKEVEDYIENNIKPVEGVGYGFKSEFLSKAKKKLGKFDSKRRAALRARIDAHLMKEGTGYAILEEGEEVRIVPMHNGPAPEMKFSDPYLVCALEFRVKGVDATKNKEIWDNLSISPDSVQSTLKEILSAVISNGGNIIGYTGTYKGVAHAIEYGLNVIGNYGDSSSKYFAKNSGRLFTKGEVKFKSKLGDVFNAINVNDYIGNGGVVFVCEAMTFDVPVVEGKFKDTFSLDKFYQMIKKADGSCILRGKNFEKGITLAQNEHKELYNKFYEAKKKGKKVVITQDGKIEIKDTISDGDIELDTSKDLASFIDPTGLFGFDMKLEKNEAKKTTYIHLVDNETTMTDFVQGAGRDRGEHKMEVFVVGYKGKVKNKVEALKNMLSKNEERKKMELNLQITRESIMGVVENLLTNMLENAKTDEERDAIREQLIKFRAEKKERDAELGLKPKETLKTLEGTIEYVKTSLKSLYGKAGILERKKVGCELDSIKGKLSEENLALLEYAVSRSEEVDSKLSFGGKVSLFNRMMNSSLYGMVDLKSVVDFVSSKAIIEGSIEYLKYIKEAKEIVEKAKEKGEEKSLDESLEELLREEGKILLPEYSGLGGKIKNVKVMQSESMRKSLEEKMERKQIETMENKFKELGVNINSIIDNKKFRRQSLIIGGFNWLILLKRMYEQRAEIFKGGLSVKERQEKIKEIIPTYFWDTVSTEFGEAYDGTAKVVNKKGYLKDGFTEEGIKKVEKVIEKLSKKRGLTEGEKAVLTALILPKGEDNISNLYEEFADSIKKAPGLIQGLVLTVFLDRGLQNEEISDREWVKILEEEGIIGEKGLVKKEQIESRSLAREKYIQVFETLKQEIEDGKIKSKVEKKEFRFSKGVEKSINGIDRNNVIKRLKEISKNLYDPLFRDMLKEYDILIYPTEIKGLYSGIKSFEEGENMSVSQWLENMLREGKIRVGLANYIVHSLIHPIELRGLTSFNAVKKTLGFETVTEEEEHLIRPSEVVNQKKAEEPHYPEVSKEMPKKVSPMLNVKEKNREFVDEFIKEINVDEESKKQIEEILKSDEILKIEDLEKKLNFIKERFGPDIIEKHPVILKTGILILGKKETPEYKNFLGFAALLSSIPESIGDIVIVPSNIVASIFGKSQEEQEFSPLEAIAGVRGST